MSRRCIAERTLLCSAKGARERRPLVVRLFEPREVESSEATFDVSAGVFACVVSIEGPLKELEETTYGVDALQALHLASNVDPLLRRLTDKLDLYFPDGEPYFDDSEE